jgi:hypothetical protein
VTHLEPVKWNGSADVVGISKCEALAVVPIGAALANGRRARVARARVSGSRDSMN